MGSLCPSNRKWSTKGHLKGEIPITFSKLLILTGQNLDLINFAGSAEGAGQWLV